MNSDEFARLVRSLAALPRQSEWVELKHNNVDPQKIGENVSTVSNGAALLRKPMGYVLWGVDDDSHDLVGTSFKPRDTRIGNQELENWLAVQLDPKIDVRIHEGQVDGHDMVLFEVPAATQMPTRFRKDEYIRVGSYTKPLRDHPGSERELWKLFYEVAFEEGVAAEHVTSDEVLRLLDYPGYFRMMDQPLPENRADILDRPCAEEIILGKAGDRFHVTNVGAVLFAQDLSRFDRLARKALRVVFYRGDNRAQTIKEHVGTKGYAIDFEILVAYINDQLPQNEQIGQALRRTVRMYPEPAVRELVANALIHQNFLIRGAGPMVEVFDSRIEISNPGTPLVDTLRFIDQPPRSRNEKLAGLMRRMNICEERGTGIDKVIIAIEMYQLPAPDFRVPGDNTVAVLFAPRAFEEMDREERVRACYQHACLMYVSGKRMTNATLRERLGIKDSNYPVASRLIKATTEAGLIKPHDGSGVASYVPFWS
jgi:predicted HTH transcriptional regulator